MKRGFVGTFAKLWKATVSFVVSVRMSAWNDSTSTRRVFIKFEIRVSSENVCRTFTLHKNLTGITGALHEDRYTECPRRNVPDFVRVFLMLNYTDIIQNTYVQIWTVTGIMAREKCGLLAGPRTVPVSWQSYPCPSLSVVSYLGNSSHARSKLLMYFLLGDKVVHVSAWHSCHVKCLEF